LVKKRYYNLQHFLIVNICLDIIMSGYFLNLALTV